MAKMMNGQILIELAYKEAVKAAEETWAALEAHGGTETPAGFGNVPLQANQAGPDGRLRKAARVNVVGTQYHLDVVSVPGGWRVDVLDRDGGQVYGADPGLFDAKIAGDSLELPSG